ncbi:hypothetical protein Tco_0947249 [Tanacetum coccineum]
MVVLMLCYFIRIMDPTSSLGKNCLGDNVYGSSSEKVEGHGDWNAPEYTDTTGSKEKKVTKALSFYNMETDKVSERYIAPCFVNGLEAYDGEINLAFDENLISNEYAVKLCLDYEVKKGNKEDDVEPGVIFGRSFMRLVNGIVDFGSRVITIYPEKDPFEDDSEKIEKNIRTSSSTGRHLTQEEAAKEALAIRISQKFTLLEEVGVTTIIAKFLILDIPIDRDAPIVVGQGFLYTIRGIVNTPEILFSTFDGICHQTFRVARSDVLRTTESDSDDEEEYEIMRNQFGATIYGPKPAAYLNCNDPAERSLALQAVIKPFRKISVWKKAVSFLGSLPVPL